MTYEDIKKADAEAKAYVKGFIEGLDARPEPIGEWIDWLGKGNEWECSICKCSIESHGSIAYNFCPNCGARMVK